MTRTGPMLCAVTCALLVLGPRPSFAQAGQTFFPGSVSLNAGLASPLEEENVVTYSSFEQGFTLVEGGGHRLIPFVTLSVAGDRAGFDWNNRVVGQAGIKYARGFRSGVVQLGAGFAHENRFASGISKSRPVWLGNYWFGWAGAIDSRRSRRVWSGFPGSSWSTVGTPGPTEGASFLGMWFVEQGVAAVRLSGVGLVPFVEQMLTLDSAGRPWNNRYHAGSGLKIRVPIGRGTFEVVGSYKHERRWIEDRAAAGPTASVNFWHGWDPVYRH